MRIFKNSQSSKLIDAQKLLGFLYYSVIVLMGIFIFVNPFPHTTAIKEICYYLSVLIVFVLLAYKKIELSLKSPFAYPAGLFVLWAFLGIFFALNKENSIHDFYSHLIRYIILYYILINFIDSKKRLVGLSWIIIISSTIFAVGGLFHFFFILGESLFTRLTSLSQHPINVIGAITGSGLLFALNQLYDEKHNWRRAAIIFCLFPLSGSIIVGQTRSVLLGIFLAGIIFFFRRKKMIIAFIGVILVIVAVSPLRDRSFSNNMKGILENERIAMGFLTFEVIKESPIIGIGFGIQTYGNLDLEKYRERVPAKYRIEIIADPHNILLDVTVRTGVVGLAVFLCIIYSFLKLCWLCASNGKDDFIKNWGRCLAGIFVVIFVIGFFQPIFSHVPEVIFCVLFSSITVLWRLNADGVQEAHQCSLDDSSFNKKRYR